MKAHAWDIKTGNEVWVSDTYGQYPWGTQMSMARTGIAYGNLYMGAYDGYVYCLDQANGKLKWEYYTGSTDQTIYGTWPIWSPMNIADGKVFFSTTEHTPTQPRIKGNTFNAIDAYTGTLIWKISEPLGGIMGGLAIADGALIASGENDGMMYCFDKGQTATTVSAPQTAVAKGTAVLISGTVMDQSPAQPNTPAVSEANMQAWMEYLHLQKTMPTNIQGVPVLLTATSPDGSTINIGTATSDGYGYYQFSWTPSNTGTYKVQATFAGSESYWSSTAETGITVSTSGSASPSVTSSPTSTATAPSSGATSLTTYIAITTAIVLIAVAASAVFLRRRTK